MAFLDLELSLSKLLASLHSSLHAAHDPLLHFPFPHFRDLALPRPLALLLLNLPPPHHEVPIAHMFLYDGGLPLRLLADHSPQPLEHLPESECAHE